ncbi:hypothetical protein SCHPADRAFT_943507 [Schizopora paradoxa]|uniref:Uncharacterized protein n=1 Tax=Schizopora paradoxa TaxID=27342 RepID=A0A0H2RCZ1_9AGAM|nr:hypothetical protein SCHPADRAFT_943507 [Schizopora paradoxa]
MRSRVAPKGHWRLTVFLSKRSHNKENRNVELGAKLRDRQTHIFQRQRRCPPISPSTLSTTSLSLSLGPPLPKLALKHKLSLVDTAGEKRRAVTSETGMPVNAGPVPEVPANDEEDMMVSDDEDHHQHPVAPPPEGPAAPPPEDPAVPPPEGPGAPPPPVAPPAQGAAGAPAGHANDVEAQYLHPAAHNMVFAWPVSCTERASYENLTPNSPRDYHTGLQQNSCQENAALSYFKAQ